VSIEGVAWDSVHLATVFFYFSLDAIEKTLVDLFRGMLVKVVCIFLNRILYSVAKDVIRIRFEVLLERKELMGRLTIQNSTLVVNEFLFDFVVAWKCLDSGRREVDSLVKVDISV